VPGWLDLPKRRLPFMGFSLSIWFPHSFIDLVEPIV
jgi:hypothetical protein